MVENTLKAAPTREENIPKTVEYTAITTEDNGIVVYASGFIQGAEESTATTSAFNFEKRTTSSALKVKQQTTIQALGN